MGTFQNKMSIRLLTVFLCFFVRTWGQTLSSEENFRGQHIAQLLSLTDSGAAFELSSFYEKQIFRPEASYYWAVVASKLGNPNVDDKMLARLRSNVFKPDFNDEQLALLPMAMRSKSFLKRRSSLITKASSGDVNAIVELRNLYLLTSKYAEETFFWASEENAKRHANSNPLESLEAAIYLSGVGEEYSLILSEMVRSEKSFWERITKGNQGQGAKN